MTKPLFEQHQISFPVPELPPVRHIIWPKQNADITVELGLSASSGPAWPSGDTMRRQIPPQIVSLSFFGIDVPIDRLLANPERCAFVDNPVADLLRRLSVFGAFNYPFAQLRMFDQLALPSTTIHLH